MEEASFEKYIDFLRENVVTLVEYKELTGSLSPDLLEVRDDLFNDDPFVVFGASVVATAFLSDDSIYH